MREALVYARPEARILSRKLLLCCLVRMAGEPKGYDGVSGGEEEDKGGGAKNKRTSGAEEILFFQT